MLKEERQKYLLAQLEKNGIVKVADIVQELKVADMTVRRDLQELEDKGLIIRIHGGAKLLNPKTSVIELSHREKKDLHLSEKIEIATIIANHIHEGDTVFLGPGTTIELAYDFLTINHAKIITNSIHVFNKFKSDPRFEIILIGGSYRNKTGAFVGTIANDFIANIHVKKSFIGVNGLDKTSVFTSNEDEGLTQRYALNSAETRYIVADHHKLDKKDFYGFYPLQEVDYLITDSAISHSQKETFGKHVQLLID
ncbi:MULTISPECIES: DeoR/GlpR family DNA-binding transcription regulator [Enterococcus]|uniref:DeoR/GlpR family DNA-binding transcription regulator n=1 Tax=Enterococcus TaxID=1350 RepID=UPI0015F269C7|nr:DeoR/GlpR family DNA-binding transcription regulator [Enterococcus hirae]MBA5269142.1 DeoR/GlpR transcriptional regulator [Enterococcus hirae]MEB5878505.1 DeoR/GlpR family DNA-binding transcription regulator [Enterococcus hirae]MEB5905491.1 DeoR/GlpR family DNA-binding transcription regulator [Enterococcus hirae]